VLPGDTAQSWELLAPALPAGMYLAGGTALAARLHHRVSRDLDFFFHADSDLDALARKLASIGSFAITQRSDGTLNGLFSQTKLQFLSAAGQQLLEAPTPIAGIPVAGFEDILAAKLKVIGDRAELRDYFDVMTIEHQTGFTVEQGLGLYLARYREPAHSYNVTHIVEALGYLDDVDEDDQLPVAKPAIAEYWGRRQSQVLRNIALTAPSPSPVRVRTGKHTPAAAADTAGPAWVAGYERSDGTRVRGHWRGDRG